jgi:BlaI family transcriptional regulator, penicillinase repressor
MSPSRKALHGLTDLQLQILGAVWDRGEATVAEVHGAIEAGPALARKTVGTMLLRLEQQGLLDHREEGREYVYRATVSREEVQRATVGNVLARLFRGDVTSLLSQALRADEVRPGDVDRVRDMLADFDAKKRGRTR